MIEIDRLRRNGSAVRVQQDRRARPRRLRVEEEVHQRRLDAVALHVLAGDRLRVALVDEPEVEMLEVARLDVSDLASVRK